MPLQQSSRWAQSCVLREHWPTSASPLSTVKQEWGRYSETLRLEMTCSPVLLLHAACKLESVIPREICELPREHCESLALIIAKSRDVEVRVSAHPKPLCVPKEFRSLFGSLSFPHDKSCNLPAM